MSTNVFDNEFMTKVMESEAWKELSGVVAWNEQLLEKYKDKVDWKEVSGNDNVLWTSSMLEKFKSRVNWDELSDCSNETLFSEENLEQYADKWNWNKLSRNYYVHWNCSKNDKFADLIDWAELIDSRAMNFGSSFTAHDFYARYKDRIPMAKLQDSNLWDEMRTETKEKLLQSIL